MTPEQTNQQTNNQSNVIQPSAQVSQNGYGNQVAGSYPGANQPPATPQMPVNNAPRKKRRWLPLVVILLLILILAGGSAGAYYGYVVPNKPNNVIKKALANVVTDPQGLGSFRLSVLNNYKTNNTTNKIEVITNGNVDSSNNVRADIQFDYSAFKVTASTIVRPAEKQMYLKIEELPSLLQLIGGQNSHIFDGLIKKLDNNWLRISVPGLQDAGIITSQQAATATKCVDALSTYIASQKTSIQNALSSAYAQNQFLDATKASSDTVNNLKATKYTLTLDKTKESDFEKALSQQLKTADDKVSSACDSKEVKSATDQHISSAKIQNITAWVSADKKLLKMSFDTFDKSSNSTTNVTILRTNDNLDTSKPSNIITPKDLKTDIEKIFGTSNFSQIQQQSQQSI